MTKWILDQKNIYHNVDDISEIWMDKYSNNEDKTIYKLKIRKISQNYDDYFLIGEWNYVEENFDMGKGLLSLMKDISKRDDVFVIPKDKKLVS